jgi:hypothetical protein
MYHIDTSDSGNVVTSSTEAIMRRSVVKQVNHQIRYRYKEEHYYVGGYNNNQQIVMPI